MRLEPIIRFYVDGRMRQLPLKEALEMLNEMLNEILHDGSDTSKSIISQLINACEEQQTCIDELEALVDELKKQCGKEGK